MPHRLKNRQKKIQDTRKQTPWRDFVMEVISRHPMVLQNVNFHVSRYPQSERIGPLVSNAIFQDERNEASNISIAGDFFSDVFMLQQSTQRSYLLVDFENENSDFADNIYGAKNTYLSFGVGVDSTNVLYSYNVNVGCDQIINSSNVSQHSSLVYHSFLVENSHSIFYSKGIYSSSDVWFSINLTNCKHCLLCDGLENKQYCIRNKQYTKDEYMYKRDTLLAQKHKFSYDLVGGKELVNRDNSCSSGTGLAHCVDVVDGFAVSRVSHARNVIMIDGTDHSTHLYDTFAVGLHCNHFYGVVSAGYNMEHVYCSLDTGTSSFVYYCMNLQGCSHCLGCIGLKNKSYCIFNKQYTKEERYDKVDEIFSQMEKDGNLGKFFPGSMNPFYFNDTAAYLIDDTFTKEEVEAKGYMWRDEPIQVDIPAGAKVVKTTELDQYEGFVISTEVERSTDTKPRFLDAASLHSKGHNEVVWRIDPEVLKVIIQDEQGNVYRIVQMEYDFLIKHGLPLPRKHWLDRMRENFRIT